MGSVSPQNSKNKVVLTYNPSPLPPFFYSLSFVKRKRGNVDFVRKPSHTRASSIPICIHASLLHAGKSPVCNMAGVVESTADDRKAMLAAGCPVPFSLHDNLERFNLLLDAFSDL